MTWRSLKAMILEASLCQYYDRFFAIERTSYLVGPENQFSLLCSKLSLADLTAATGRERGYTSRKHQWLWRKATWILRHLACNQALLLAPH